MDSTDHSTINTAQRFTYEDLREWIDDAARPAGRIETC